jgi:hypothetical protein
MSRGARFRWPEPEVIGSRPGTHALGLHAVEPIASGSAGPQAGA